MKAILARPGANRLNACHAGKRPITLGSTQLFPLYEFMHHNQSGPMEALWLRWKDRLSIKVYLHHKIGGGIHFDIDCRE